MQASLSEFESMAKYDTEMSARVGGIVAQFASFAFLFGFMLGEKVPSRKPQQDVAKKDLPVAEGQAAAKLTLAALKKLQKDTAFQEFWDSVRKVQDDTNVDEPTLPRKRIVPDQYNDGAATPHFLNTV